LVTALAMLAPRVARAQERQPVIAVFEIEDATKRPKRLISSLTDYLRVKVAETGQIKVVDKGEQEASLKRIVKSEKKKSYSACVDESCQIPLGKELAADKILRGKLTRFGKSFVITLEVVDLATETSAGAASDKSDGSEEGLMGSVERIVHTLMASMFPKPAAEPVAVTQEPLPSVQAAPPPQPIAQAPTRAKVELEHEATAAELAMVIGGWSVFAVAYIAEIIITLAGDEAAYTYYAFFPVVGPIMIEVFNRSTFDPDTGMTREPKPINYVDAGVQALGAGIAVLGHILIETGEPNTAPAAASSGPSAHFFFGPTGFGIAGTF
jgi:hypothetical protein